MTVKWPVAFDVPKRAGHCSQCQRDFIPGSVCKSSLFEKEGWQRSDYCQSCAKVLFPQDSTVCWQSKIPESEEAALHPKESLLRAEICLKERLSASSSPQEQKEAFLLALYLQRKKVLTLKKEVQIPGAPLTYLFEIQATGELLFVPKVAIADNERNALQMQIATLIHSANPSLQALKQAQAE